VAMSGKRVKSANAGRKGEEWLFRTREKWRSRQSPRKKGDASVKVKRGEKVVAQNSPKEDHPITRRGNEKKEKA